MLYETRMSRRARDQGSMPARRTTKHAPRQTAFALGLIAKPTVRPSRYQEAIYRFVEGGTGDGFIVAAAGSGKTTTLVEAAQLVRADKAIFLAFNKHIARELEHRLHNSPPCGLRTTPHEKMPL